MCKYGYLTLVLKLSTVYEINLTVSYILFIQSGNPTSNSYTQELLKLTSAQ